ncbi:ABC-three component system middle component 1 [Psychrobacter jeotgali]|uniref:ABC-three component system middle component 1 n=1 Tax=Psychrobacter jeotgali TaxID=179010 RepID=UPI001917C015|nr:ABC-three component system middle component 1 [Psychrobacter jeotgali]
MLKDILSDALEEHDFRLESETEFSKYYILQEESAIRFAIIYELYDVVSAEELNTLVTKNSPSSFLENPAYKKNSDLICILKIEHLASFKSIEDEIFAIEEDPYQYKKYVLYYIDAEEAIIKDINFNDLKKVISDKHQFTQYKIDPLQPSMYSLAARIFIKLPFLELPHNNDKLIPLKHQAQEAVSENELSSLYEKIQKSQTMEYDEDKLIEELINNEMENI